MKATILISSLAILLINCYNKENDFRTSYSKNNETIGDSLIYSFLNTVLLKENRIYIKCDNIIDRNLFYKKEDSTFYKNAGNILSENDRHFMREQYQNNNNFVLNEGLIKNKKLIKINVNLTNIEQKEFRKKLIKTHNCVSQIDIPLFNLKKDIAIVTIGYTCGSLCGEGATFVYKLNKDNEWKLFRILEGWES